MFSVECADIAIIKTMKKEKQNKIGTKSFLSYWKRLELWLISTKLLFLKDIYSEIKISAKV